MYYFGCIGRAGHYLWKNEYKYMWMEVPDGFPKEWTFTESSGSMRIGAKESAIAPNCYGEQGLAQIQHVEGWTCVSFPDRSVDSRPNCVSAFMEYGTLTFEEMMVTAKEQFPSVVDRYEFEVKLAQ